MPPKLAAVAMWLIAIVFYGVVGGHVVVPQLIFLHNLSSSNIETEGRIIETYPQMHSTCKYRYLVDGHVYEETGRSCGADTVGQRITVYFSTTDPTKSLNVNPAAAFVNDLIPFVAALVFFPLFAAMLAYKRARPASATA